MAKSRIKTWATSEILTAADLNAEFDNFLTNPMDLISPATATLDMNGQTLILDADADTNIAASSDDQIDITLGGVLIYTILAASWDFNGKQLILDADGDSSLTVDTDDVAHLELQGMDAFIFDGNVASPVNGLTFTSSATGVAVGIDAHGTDTNIGITITPKGSGVILAGGEIDMNGLELILDADADTSLTADSDDIVHMKVQGFDAFIFDGDVGTPVNGLTFFSAATTGAAAIGAHGSDTNINIDLIPKGGGVVDAQGGINVPTTKFVTIADAPVAGTSAANKTYVDTEIAGAGFGTPLAIAIVAEEQTSGTAGGTFTSGAWRTRLLNTEVSDPDGIVSIASNAFTLGAGSYIFIGYATGHSVARHQCRIQNTSDASTVSVGSSSNEAIAVGEVGTSHVYGFETIAGSKTYELQHQSSATRASDGFGLAASLGTEQYSAVYIIQIA